MIPVRVTVVIPVHNGAHLITRALESIYAQTAPVGEVIVIDDGSTDELEDVLNRYSFEGRVISQKQAGQGAALNSGIKAASYEYLAFLDHDDEWVTDKTQWQLDAITSTAADAVVGSVTNRRIHPDGVIEDQQMGSARVLGASLMRTDAARATGSFPEDSRTHEIFDWWSRATQTLNVHKDPRPALIRHVHGGNQTMQPEHHDRSDLLSRIRDHRRRHA